MKHAFLKNQLIRNIYRFQAILKSIVLSNLVFNIAAVYFLESRSSGHLVFAQSKIEAASEKLAAQQLQAEIELPDFWLKPPIQKQMFENRKIIVSTLHRESSTESYWSFKGAGYVSSDFQEAQEKLRDFSKLPEVSDNFESAEWISEKSLLNVEVKFLGRIYLIPLKIREVVTKDEYQLYFDSHQHEYFKGIEGRIRVEKSDLKGHPLLLSFKAVSQRMPSYVPDLVIQVASEAVMHHVADLLRKHLEKVKK